MFVFKIIDSRIITYKETAARSCRILFYSTKHYLPIDPEHNKELEVILSQNSLPRMNMMMFGAFKFLSQREKETKGQEFQIHEIPKMVEQISKGGEEYQIQANNIETYFNNMAVNQIITPVREITEFIEDDLIATDPKYLGDVVGTVLQLDKESKKVTNTKIDAKRNYMLIIALIAIVGAIAFGGFYLLSNGGSAGLGNLFPQLTPNNSHGAPSSGGVTKLTDQQVFAKYPTPESLNNAIDKGELKIEQLSPAVQKLVKGYKPPS